MDEITNIFNDVSFRDESWVLLVPFCLMAIDVLTGVVAAWKTGHAKSYKMREGLGRKFGEVMILFIGQLFITGMNLPKFFSILFSFFFPLYIVVMELTSISENLKKLGVPIPKWVDKGLEQVNEIIQNGNKSEQNSEVNEDGDGEGKA